MSLGLLLQRQQTTNCWAVLLISLFYSHTQADTKTVQSCSKLIDVFRQFPNPKLSEDALAMLRELDSRLQTVPIAQFILSEMNEMPRDMRHLELFQRHRQCLDKLTLMTRYCRCLSSPTHARPTSPLHKQVVIVVVKVIRATLRSVEETIRRVGDLSVIQLVRDPRAIAVSQHKTQIR